MARTMKDRIASRTHFAKSMKKPASAPASSSSFLNKKKHVSPPIVKSISKQTTTTPKLSIWNRSYSQPLQQISSTSSSVINNKKSVNDSKQIQQQKPLSNQTSQSKKRTQSKKVHHQRSMKVVQQRQKMKSRKGSIDSADIELNTPMLSDNSSVILTRRRSKPQNVVVNKAGSSNQNQQQHQQLKQQQQPQNLSKQNQQKSQKAKKSKLISAKKPEIKRSQSNQQSIITSKKLLRSGKDFGVNNKRISATNAATAVPSLPRRTPVKTFTQSPQSSSPSSSSLSSSPQKAAVIIPKRKSIAKPSKNKVSKQVSPSKSSEQKKRQTLQQKKLQQIKSPSKPTQKEQVQTRRSKKASRKTHELTSNSGSESENPTTTEQSTQQQQQLLQYRGVKSNRVIRDEDDNDYSASNQSTAKKHNKIVNSFSQSKSKIEFDYGLDISQQQYQEKQQQQQPSSTFSQKIKQKVAAIISLIPPISIPPSPTSYKSHIRRNQQDASLTIQQLFEENKNKVQNQKKLGLTELFPMTDSQVMPIEAASAPMNNNNNNNNNNLYKKSKQQLQQQQQQQQTEVQQEQIPLPSHLRFLKDEGKEEQFEIKQSSKRLIDIVFCCDTTSSMGDYLHATIDQIAAIYKKTQPFSQVIDVKYGFVCYRDHHPEESTYLYRISNLGSALQTIQFIQKQDASGGGDTPEAVMDGLYVATAGINWRSFSRKYIIHIADAPPHGDIYTGVRGGFLERSFQWHDGCPCGLSIEKIARSMNSLKIHYRLIRAGENMSRMAAIFKSCIQHYAEMKVSSPKGLDFILSDMIAKQCLSKEDISEDFNRPNNKHEKQHHNQQQQQYKEQKQLQESFQQQQQQQQKQQQGEKKENLNRSIQSQKALQFEKLLLKKYEEVLAAKNAFMEQLEQQKESDERIDGESMLLTRSKRNRSKTNSQQTGQQSQGEQSYNHMRKNNIFEEYYNNYNNNNKDNNTQESVVEMKPLNTRRRSILF